MIGRLFATSAVVLLVACSKPTETVIPSDMSQWEKDLAKASRKLSEEDRKLLAGYLTRVKMGSILSGGAIDIPVGTTIGDAIKEQRAWLDEQAETLAAEKKREAEEKALRERLKAERQAMIDDIHKAVTVTLIEKDQRPANPSVRRYRDEQVFVIGVENRSNHAIKGVSGELEFVDLFDKVVGAVSFRITEDVEPGGTVTWTGTRDYNEFIKEHRAVWNLEEGDFKTRFIPEALVFANGITYKVPDQ